MDKASIRKLYLDKRKNLSHTALAEAQHQILAQLMDLPWASFSNVHLFMAIPGRREIDLTPLMKHLWAHHPKLQLAVPTITEYKSLKHILVHTKTRWHEGPYGIPEPVEGTEITPAVLDLVLVPLLAFDLHGHRVGYGQGYYDRFLAQCADHTQRIGLSLWGPGPEINSESTDIVLHQVYTPQQVFDFNQA